MKGMKGQFQGLYSEQKDNNSMGTPPCLQDQKSVVMHRLIYKWSHARGSLSWVAKIRLLDTSDGGKSPSGFSLDPPHNAARNLTSRHDLNNLNPVSGVRSSYFSDPLTNFIQLTTLLTTVRPSTSLSAVTRQRYPDSRIVPSFRYNVIDTNKVIAGIEGRNNLPLEVLYVQDA